MREEVMSAWTAERAVHEPMGDDPMEIGAVGKSGKKGTGKRRVGESTQAKEKAPGPRTTMQIESAFTVPGRGHNKEECRVRIADERDSKSKDEKDKRKDKQFRQKEKTSECDGRSRT